MMGPKKENKMKTMLLVVAATLATPSFAVPLAAQIPAAQAKSPRQADAAAVRAVLAQYKSAIERLDATGTERLFTADSTIFETGGVEGNYANYLAHHLGPELKEFRAFKFSDYKIDVRFEGPLALATESYTYRIDPKTGEPAVRRGVATSVLKKVSGRWKILSMHNSARKPKGS
jgi:uncharacterized protein (TIGR02246 family)